MFGGDPSSFLTANMKKVINVMLQKVEDPMKETFFETCVSNTAHEMQKGDINLIIATSIFSQLFKVFSVTTKINI